MVWTGPLPRLDAWRRGWQEAGRRDRGGTGGGCACDGDVAVGPQHPRLGGLARRLPPTPARQSRSSSCCDRPWHAMPSKLLTKYLESDSETHALLPTRAIFARLRADGPMGRWADAPRLCLVCSQDLGCSMGPYINTCGSALACSLLQLIVPPPLSSSVPRPSAAPRLSRVLLLRAPL